VRLDADNSRRPIAASDIRPQARPAERMTTPVAVESASVLSAAKIAEQVAILDSYLRALGMI
jgi:hypothetical protein